MNLKELVVLNKPKSSQSEAFKTLRTNLLFSSVDKKIKSLLITSTMPGEGKSYTTANLAVAFAQAGTKVLIVDTDMRRGRQDKIFNISNEEGLSNLLLENNIGEAFKKYIKETEVKNIHVLTSGMVPPNPSELLSSDKLKKLVNTLENHYDLVIYDGVPIIGLADSLLIASIVTKIVIVTAYKVTTTTNINQLKKNLEPFKDKIAGVILNKTEAKKSSYYDYYY